MGASGLLTAILLAAPYVAQSGACLHYGPPYVSLEGRITSVRSVTPSGTPDNHWYVDTVAPVCISGDGGVGDLDVPTTQHIEFTAPSNRNLGALDGQYVTLTGEFMHTHIPTIMRTRYFKWLRLSNGMQPPPNNRWRGP